MVAQPSLLVRRRRDSRGMVCRLSHARAKRTGKTSGRLGRSSLCGDYRDEKKPAVVMSNTSTDLQDFTGATGLKPATSGVTGRSWRLRADWGRAGIPGASWPFRPCRCGDCRVLAGAFDRLPRDERGMRRCLGRERSRRRDALHRAAFSGAISDGAWWVSRGFLGKPASVIRIRSE